MRHNQKEHDSQEEPKHTEIKEEHPKPKNVQVASTSGGHTQTNIDLLKVLNFIQETMQTLRHIQLSIDPSGNVVNLSKHLFSFDMHKLLNKNFNFIPTSKSTIKINFPLI